MTSPYNGTMHVTNILRTSGKSWYDKDVSKSDA